MRGRIRTIKPEALLDDALWDLEEQTGMPIFRAFTGLWMYADREGRFEWKARPLKAVILPYWDGDFSAVLDAMAGAGFVRRYEVDGRHYGVVVNFCKHQTPNAREPKSVIPGPPVTNPHVPTHVHACAGSDAGDAPVTDAHVGKGREGKGTGRELDLEGNSRARAKDPPDQGGRARGAPRRIGYVVPEAPDDASVELAEPSTRALLLRTFRDGYERKTGTVWPGPQVQRGKGDDPADIAAWVDAMAARHELPPRAVIVCALECWEDEWVKTHRWPWHNFAQRYAERFDVARLPGVAARLRESA